MSEKNNDNAKYPPVRFPRELRDALQEEANELARSRGKETMSIADYIAERRAEWIEAATEPEEEG